jgi:hypothetical protein
MRTPWSVPVLICVPILVCLPTVRKVLDCNRKVGYPKWFLGVLHALAWATSMSVAFFSNSANLDHCCNNINRGHCWITLLEQLLQIPLLPFVSLLHLLPCWRHRPWRPVKNTFRISVLSKEHTIPVQLYLKQENCAGLLTSRKTGILPVH